MKMVLNRTNAIKGAIAYLTAILLLLSASLASRAMAAETTAKQPVFLICPHKEKYSAWSVYLTVDSSDPSKVLSLGLEKLVKKNSKDSSYEAVLEAQASAKAEHEQIGTLDAKDFGSGQIEVKKDDALRLSVSSAGDGALRLMMSLRINADQRFVIGGKEQSKRDVLLRYNKEKKTWSATAVTLLDAEGKKVVDANGRPMSGIVFPVTGTGIYTIVGVLDNSDSVKLLDK